MTSVEEAVTKGSPRRIESFVVPPLHRSSDRFCLSSPSEGKTGTRWRPTKGPRRPGQSAGPKLARHPQQSAEAWGARPFATRSALPTPLVPVAARILS
jgi:hypothetical protein